MFSGKLELEFAVQLHDIVFHIADQEHQSIESVYHWDADVFHRSTIVGRGIIYDYCGKQIVVLVGNLQIGGWHQRSIHLDHLAISSDINHIRSTEESG